MSGEGPGTKTATVSTTSESLSAEDLELAAYLDVLMEMELLESWEQCDLLPVLEVSDEP